MRKVLLGVMGLVMALTMATAGFAEDVFVTKSGKFYHHAESPFIKNRETTKLSKEEAEDKGYKPSKSYVKSLAAQNIESVETK